LKKDLSKKNEKRRQSEYFHSADKGCEIEKRIYYRTIREKKSYKLQGSFCKTHQKEICKCGWEWKFHFGTHSKQWVKVC